MVSFRLPEGDWDVDGLDGFVLEGVDAEGEGFYYEYGVVSGKNTVFLELQVLAPTAKSRAWIESILATVTWK